MTDSVEEKLDFNRKLLLSVPGLLVVAMSVLFGLRHATQSQAQSQSQNTAARSLVYDVVSIKPDKSGNDMATLRVSRDGFIGGGITMLTLIGEAYRVEDHLRRTADVEGHRPRPNA